ncbi:hypothetical membrane protein [Solidesulfovibrio magneticus RS-1]|uniref:Hypothetical membrane protein n=2 Tax=Solidesulfovibrio TaxID=2910984 RepID=C4XPP2_SOLM1|nr:hypothetical membrane protein [Solidesulfovibrio magneticus RS-1]
MKPENPCKACPIRGYSPEVCNLHHKFMNGDNRLHCPDWLHLPAKPKKVGKTLAFGACVGLATSFVGLAAAGVVGLKAALEMALVAKVVTGAGMAGAVTNVVVAGEEETKATKPESKRKHFVPPFYLNGS